MGNEGGDNSPATNENLGRGMQICNVGEAQGGGGLH